MRKVIMLCCGLLPAIVYGAPFRPTVGPVTVAAATLQAATNGHAYWISPTGALLDAGTSISAASPTKSPPVIYDLSMMTHAQWSVFYGAQTGAVKCKVGIAELWPTQPVQAAAIPPYVKDAAVHPLNASGIGSPVTQRLPADLDLVWDVTSAANTAQDTGAFAADDYESIVVEVAPSGSASATSLLLKDPDAGVQVGFTTPANTNTYVVHWGEYSQGIVGNMLGGSPGPLPPRAQVTLGALGSGITSRLRVIAKRTTPLRRLAKVAPYIQCATYPSSASPIYLEVWGANDAVR